MRQAEDPPAPPVARTGPSAATSPAKALAIVLLLLIAIVGAVLLITPDDPPPITLPETTNFALTDAEALAVFQELDSRRIEAYRLQDPTLLAHAFTATSPILERVEREIREIGKANVDDLTEFRTVRLEVLSNHADEIEIRQVVIVSPRFLNPRGENVALSRDAQRQSIDWVLRRSGSQWLIHSGTVIAQHAIGGSG